jgi:hypothetical protein
MNRPNAMVAFRLFISQSAQNLKLVTELVDRGPGRRLKPLDSTGVASVAAFGESCRDSGLARLKDAGRYRARLLVVATLR